MIPGRTALCMLTLLTATCVGLAQDVSTGPSPLQESRTASAYLRGAAPATAKPTQVRVLGARRSEAGVTIEALLLDARGNACPAGTEGGSWLVRSGCRGDALLSEHEPIITGRTWQTTSPPTAMQVLVDHSLLSDGMAPDVLRGIRDILPGILGADSIGVAVFDHQTTTIAEITAPYLVAQRIDQTPLQPSTGLPGVHQAIRNGLRLLADRTDESKILTVVTASNDLTGLGVSVSSLVALARSSGIVIHVIKVGYSAQGYLYRYVSAATGGRLYTIDPADRTGVVNILREILYGSKHHVELFVARTPIEPACDDLLFSVGWQVASSDTLLADTLMVPMQEREYMTARAVLAVLPDTNEVGLKQHYALLTQVAEDLLEDSSKVLQLVGHVSPDVKSDHDERALERAGYVSAFLQANGVRPSQIRIRSAGSREPMFYLQQDGTQRLLNNRVEGYYLFSADLPFTIAVGQYATEEQAEDWVQTWVDRGYKAYFEPIVVDRAPAYRVKLWGYETENAALVDARIVRTKHQAPFAVVE